MCEGSRYRWSNVKWDAACQVSRSLDTAGLTLERNATVAGCGGGIDAGGGAVLGPGACGSAAVAAAAGLPAVRLGQVAVRGNWAVQGVGARRTGCRSCRTRRRSQRRGACCWRKTAPAATARNARPRSDSPPSASGGAAARETKGPCVGGGAGLEGNRAGGDGARCTATARSRSDSSPPPSPPGAGR